MEVAHQFVDEVRAARPETALVLSTALGVNYGRVPGVRRPSREPLLPRWGTPESPVAVATRTRAWLSATDTCDSTHPSAVGEVKIAAAQADALADPGHRGRRPRARCPNPRSGLGSRPR